jgi:hypothetical protein
MGAARPRALERQRGLIARSSVRRPASQWPGRDARRGDSNQEDESEDEIRGRHLRRLPQRRLRYERERRSYGTMDRHRGFWPDHLCSPGAACDNAEALLTKMFSGRSPAPERATAFGDGVGGGGRGVRDWPRVCASTWMSARTGRNWTVSQTSLRGPDAAEGRMCSRERRNRSDQVGTCLRQRLGCATVSAGSGCPCFARRSPAGAGNRTLPRSRTS